MMLLLVLLAPVCVDPLQEDCKVACIYEGYDTGRYEQKQCACISYFKLSDLIAKKVFVRAPYVPAD